MENGKWKMEIENGKSVCLCVCLLPSALPSASAFCFLFILLLSSSNGCRRGGEPGTLVIAIEVAPEDSTRAFLPLPNIRPHNAIDLRHARCQGRQVRVRAVLAERFEESEITESSLFIFVRV